MSKELLSNSENASPDVKEKAKSLWNQLLTVLEDVKIKKEKRTPPPKSSKIKKRNYRTKAGVDRESSEELPEAYKRKGPKSHKSKHKKDKKHRRHRSRRSTKSSDEYKTKHLPAAYRHQNSNSYERKGRKTHRETSGSSRNRYPQSPSTSSYHRSRCDSRSPGRYSRQNRNRSPSYSDTSRRERPRSPPYRKRPRSPSPVQPKDYGYSHYPGERWRTDRREVVNQQWQGSYGNEWYSHENRSPQQRQNFSERHERGGQYRARGNYRGRGTFGGRGGYRGRFNREYSGQSHKTSHYQPNDINQNQQINNQTVPTQNKLNDEENWDDLVESVDNGLGSTEMQPQVESDDAEIIDSETIAMGTHAATGDDDKLDSNLDTSPLKGSTSTSRLSFNGFVSNFRFQESPTRSPTNENSTELKEKDGCDVESNITKLVSYDEEGESGTESEASTISPPEIRSPLTIELSD